MKCGASGKVRHYSKTAAVAAMKRVNNAGLSCYPCRSCGGWHLGTSHSPWKQQARIDQILARFSEPAQN